MKPIRRCLQAIIAGVAVAALGTAIADTPIPITAEEAFDAVTMHLDPETGTSARVALIDIRDPVEYFSSGAAARVNRIHLIDTKKKPIEPDWGKVRLVQEGKHIEYCIDGRYRKTPVVKISRMETYPLARNIPFWRRTPSGWDQSKTNDFYAAIEDLANDYDVLILYCRTGGRSSLAGSGVDSNRFKVYEIDAAEKDGQGGFSGPAYNNIYNGFNGFPGRPTGRQDYPSVSWSDSGLPITYAFMPINP